MGKKAEITGNEPNRIRELRLEKGWSQTRLAELLNTKQETVGKLERGTIKLSLDWLGKLAAIFDAAPQDVLSKNAAPVERSAAMLAITAAPVSPTATKGDVDMAGAMPMMVDKQRPIPVYASAAAGDGSTLIDHARAIEYTARPSSLQNVPEAYGVYVVSTSMEPKYFHGDLLYVHPHKPLRPGKCVVVVKKNGVDDGEQHALVKQLVKVDKEEIVLQQFNPKKKIVIRRSDIITIHTVVGSLDGGV